MHPAADRLQLTGERIVGLSASIVRCSVLTASGKVATIVDETLGDLGARQLETPATAVTEVGSFFFFIYFMFFF